MALFRTLLRVALISLVACSFASAAPPEVITYPLPISGVLGDCGEFEILREADYIVTETTFFNGSGDVDRVTLRWDGTETFINSETDFSIPGMPFHGLVVLTETEQLTRGFFLGGNVPGLGMVLLNAGNVTFDFGPPVTITFEHGTFDNLFFSDDPPQLERLCEALEGPTMKPKNRDATWATVKRLYR